MPSKTNITIANMAAERRKAVVIVVQSICIRRWSNAWMAEQHPGNDQDANRHGGVRNNFIPRMI